MEQRKERKPVPIQDASRLLLARRLVTKGPLGYVNLNALMRPNDQASAYAVAFVKSASEQKASVRIGSDGRDVWIEVEDHGPGIPPAEQERIFERFYRIDKDRSRQLGGTGLGLSIVRNLLVAHGGDVSVDSRPGEGSRFCMRLPISAKHRKTRATATEQTR